MNNKEIKVLIADDHTLFIDGIKRILEDETQIKIVAEAYDGNEVFIKLNSYYIDVIILDIEMKGTDGFVTAKIIKEKFPDIKILILTMHNQFLYIEKMYQLGVSGYLLKNTNKAELVEAIKQVHRGNQYYNSEVINQIFNKEKIKKNIKSNDLTKRETEVLILISKELSNNEIADRLHLSVETINSHRKNIMRKLNVKNTAGLIIYAINNNLL